MGPISTASDEFAMLQKDDLDDSTSPSSSSSSSSSSSKLGREGALKARRGEEEEG